MPSPASGLTRRERKPVNAITVLSRALAGLGLDGRHGPGSTGRDPLTGTWEITAIIDNGELIPENQIRQQWVRDARIYISGQMLSLIRPGSQRRDLLFVTDPNASPKTMEIAGGTDRTGSKGIYYLDGSSLFLCMAGPGGTNRPTDFASRPGSNNILMILKKVDTSTTVQPPINSAAPRGTARPGSDAAAQSGRAVSPDADRQLGHQDRKGRD